MVVIAPILLVLSPNRHDIVQRLVASAPEVNLLGHE